MPAAFNPDARRTTLDLSSETRRQLVELMGDNQESLKDCIAICIAERHQREFGTPERDVFAEFEQRLAALERIAAEGYESWFEANREKIGL
jgi:hypothetical protein